MEQRLRVKSLLFVKLIAVVFFACICRVNADGRTSKNTLPGKLRAPRHYLDKVGLASISPASGAYAFRLLSSTFRGPLVRITVDGSYYDVYPDASTNKIFSLSSPISAPYDSDADSETGATSNLLSSIIISNHSAGIAIWYDQSGNNRSAIQQSIGNQPQIITNGIINNTNGLPTAIYSGTQWLAIAQTFIRSDFPNAVVNVVYQNTVHSGNQGLWGADDGGWDRLQLLNFDDDVNASFGLSNGGGTNPNTDIVTTNQIVYSAVMNYATSDATFISINGVESTPFTENNNGDTRDLGIGAISGGGQFGMIGNISEFILFLNTVATTDRHALEANQMGYYLNVFTATTNTATAITPTTATLAGTAVADGGFPITVKGIVYGKTVNPVIAVDQVLSDGGGLGAISVNASNLEEGTLYHYRAFVTNSTGTVYGSELTFTTPIAPNIFDKLGLTDATPAASGYSMRLLSGTYTGPLARIQVANLFYDVYPDASAYKHFSLTSPISAAYPNGNDAKTGTTANTLSSIVSSSTGAGISTWYDQSGNGNDASQTDVNRQPDIIIAGSILTQNAKPAPKFSPSRSTLLESIKNVKITSLISMNVVGKSLSNAPNGNLIVSNASSWIGVSSGSLGYAIGQGGAQARFDSYFNGSDPYPTKAFVATGTYDGNAVNFYMNGTRAVEWIDNRDISSNAPLMIGSGQYESFDGYVPEITVFTSSLSTTERATIEDKQTDYYALNTTLVITRGIVSKTSNSATLSGSVQTDGGHAITAKGIVFGKTANPVITIDGVQTDTNTGVGDFTVTATNLDAGTDYHYRTFATNSIGTFYGDDLALTIIGAPTVLDKLGLSASTSAKGAYALRLLGSSYTGPLVRINMNGSFYDVYPDATPAKAFSFTSPISAAYANYNLASTGATSTLLGSIVAANSATVAIWYDQSKQDNNAVQGNSNRQPGIINAGVITVDDKNNLPALTFDGTRNLTVITTDFNGDLSGSVVYNANADNDATGGGNWYSMNGILGAERPGGDTDFGYGIFNGKFTAGSGPDDVSLFGNEAVNDGKTKLSSWTRSTSTGETYLYNASVDDGSATTTNVGDRGAVPDVSIGSIQVFDGGGVFFHGTMSELTLFPSIYSPAERTAIENSQGNYYHVAGINTDPTDITLSNAAVNENVAAGSTIGTLTTADAQGGAMTYALTTGAGDTDNNAFTITNDILSINAKPDFETKSSYAIRVKVTDGGGLSFEKSFTISINDLAEVVINQSVFSTANVGGSYSASITASGGTAPYLFAVTAGNLPTGLSIVSNAGNDIISGQPSAAGTFNFTVTATDNNGFTGSKAFSIVIGAGTSTITYAPTAAKTYGDADFDPAASSTNTSTAIVYSSSNTSIATIVANKVHILKPGTVTIYADQPANADYNAGLQQAQILTIEKKVLTLTLNAVPAITRVYDGSLTATLVAANYNLSGKNGADIVTISGQTTYNTKDAGTGKTITVENLVLDGADKANYTLSTLTATTTGSITPAALMITANDQSKMYGAALPSLTATYSGFVNGDTQASLTTAPTLNTTATTASAVNIYPITAGGAVNPNYLIAYTAGKLTVGQAALTITANDQSKTYGAALPSLTATYSGFVNGDTQASLTTAPVLSTTATTASAVNIYPITASGAVSSNYLIAYTAGKLTVGQAALMITANDQSKTYGAALPSLTATYSGFVNGDTQASLTTTPVLSTTATPSSAVNIYPITARGAVSPNYLIAYTAGKLTVGQAALTITANNQSILFGAALPALTASYSGFVNGDLPASMAISPVLSTTATVGSPANTYPITVAGAVNGNYAITYRSGSLVINKNAAVISFRSPGNATYGDGDIVLAATSNSTAPISYSSDNTAVVTIINNSIHIVKAGTANITASQDASGNYNSAASVVQSFTVSKAALVITADNQAKLYGQANPTFTLSYSGFKFSDNQNSLSTQPNVTTNAATTSLPGRYTLTAGDAVSPNYNFTYVPGVLVINPSRVSGLNALTLSEGVLSPAFATNRTAYTASVRNTVKEITLTATLTDASGTITINGQQATNGSASGTLPLSIGNNRIVISTTAQDGVTITSYEINVSRAEPIDNIVATNILTPNGDGKNDTWKIQDILLYPENIVTIYDQAGRIVFTQKGYANDWGGTVNGQPLNEGTYYYTVDLGQDFRKFKGFITLLRSR